MSAAVLFTRKGSGITQAILVVGVVEVVVEIVLRVVLVLLY